MYGMADSYGSPVAESDAFGDEDAEIDDLLDEDDEDDEFGAILGIGKGGGILGIAITDKAKRNKMNRLLGHLKQYYEQGKLDKARRYAKALAAIDPIKKKKDGWITPEVQAWIDYAESGDSAALEEALGAIAWTGDEDTEDKDVEGDVYDEGGQVVGRGRRHKGVLPPGFRPKHYGRWSAGRKSYWLGRHPRAASIRVPADPGGRGGGHGHGHGRRHPGRHAGHGQGRVAPVVRSASPVRTFAAAPPSATVRPPISARVAPPVAARGPVRPARPIAARAVAHHFRGLDDAVAEGVEDFGSLIGADAFEPLQGRHALPHDDLFSDDLDDEVDELDSDDDGDDEGEDFGAYVPQFGAVFTRSIENRLEGARRQYERLRATSTDQEQVQAAWDAYKRLQKAYAAASERPTAQRKGPALAEELEATFSLRSGGGDDEDDDLGDHDVDLGDFSLAHGF